MLISGTSSAPTSGERNTRSGDSRGRHDARRKREGGGYISRSVPRQRRHARATTARRRGVNRLQGDSKDLYCAVDALRHDARSRGVPCNALYLVGVSSKQQQGSRRRPSRIQYDRGVVHTPSEDVT